MILLHGGGGYTGAPSDMDVWRDVHLGAGRSTFAIEYALVTEVADGALWPLAEQNVKAAVQYIRADGTLGPRSISLHGVSAGARLAAIVGTTADDPAFAGPELWPDVSDAVDGAIAFYGYYDGFQFYGEEYYGPTVPTAAIPLENADPGDAAVMLVHGLEDQLVPVGEALGLGAAIEDAGGDVTLVLVDGNHAFDHLNDDGVILALTPAGEDLKVTITDFISGLGPAE